VAIRLVSDKWANSYAAAFDWLELTWSRVLPAQLTGPQLVKKLPTLYWAQIFITAFTSAQHLYLHSVRGIEPIAPHPTSWRTILILSSHLRLCLRSYLFPSGLPTKILSAPLLSPTCPGHLNLLDWIIRLINNLIIFDYLEQVLRYCGHKSRKMRDWGQKRTGHAMALIITWSEMENVKNVTADEQQKDTTLAAECILIFYRPPTSG